MVFLCFNCDCGASSGTRFPTGTVNFFDSTKQIGSALLTSGQASFTTSVLSGGTHNLTASYGGDANYSASVSTSQPVIITTAKPGGITLVSSLNPEVGGQPVSFTATVTSNSGTATGTVTFLDGTATIGSAALNGNGIASFATTALGVGAHPITANYAGDQNYASATSSVVTETVAAAGFAPVTSQSVQAGQTGHDQSDAVRGTGHHGELLILCL